MRVMPIDQELAKQMATDYTVMLHMFGKALKNFSGLAFNPAMLENFAKIIAADLNKLIDPED